MPNVRWVTVAAALVLALGGCGSDDEGDAGGGEEGGAQKLTIYSSLPLQGAARAQALATVNGAKLALKQAGGRVGDYTVEYHSLDDSTAQAGGWEPGQTSSNARKAIADDSTIAYIGEFNSGATAVSLPLLNEAGIAQVSPGNTAVGITSDDALDDAGLNNQGFGDDFRQALDDRRQVKAAFNRLVARKQTRHARRRRPYDGLRFQLVAPPRGPGAGFDRRRHGNRRGGRRSAFRSDRRRC